MKHLFIIALLVGLTAEKPVPETTLSNPQYTGATPRLTTDAAGNPLLSWVEKQDDKTATFYFAISTDAGLTFGPKVRVNVPANVSVHAEGMPKIAQKSDGTLLALFEVPRPVRESRFAGDLLCVMSTNGGRTWSEPKAVHRDVSPGKSHSFGDLTRLPNGEIGIIWLDDKLPGQDGRSVKFVQTRPDDGFTNEVIVDSSACQCCRTNVFVDSRKRIHLTYRDLASAKTGETAARDISHVVSTDGGGTFSKPAVLIADDWRINACPHTGPSVAQVGDGLLATWFSGKDGAVGLRLAKIGDSKPVAIILSNRAKHPQVTALNGGLVWVWDEAVRKAGQPADEPMPQYNQRIALRTTPDGPATFVSPESVNAAYPVVLATRNGFVLAYEQKQGDGNAVIVARLVSSAE